MTGRRYTLEEAKKLMSDFLGAFPQLRDWMSDVHKSVLQYRYVETGTGRRRRFPYISSRNMGAVQRRAVNTVCQSLASDFTLNAISCLDRALPEGSVIFATVHDSILFEIPTNRLEEALIIINDCMIEPPIEDFNVPIKADINYGEDWGSASGY